MSATLLKEYLQRSDGQPFPFAVFAEHLVAPVRLALLELAIELELPDIIAKTQGLSGIATQLGTIRTEKLAYMLDALAAMGLLRKANGVYYNTDLAETYLRKSKPAYLGELITTLKAMQHRNIHRLKDVLFSETAPVPAGQALHDKALWRRAAGRLANYQKAGVADAMADIAASLPGAATFQTMLELGCGPGITSFRILGRLPRLHVTLCDFAPVLQVAEQEAVAAGMRERVSFLPGNYNTVDWGQGYDLIWAAQSLYYAENLQTFVKRIVASLKPGGLFVSIHEGVRSEGTEPALLVISRLSLALEGQDVSFSKGHIAKAAKEAGCIRIHTAQVPLLFDDADLEVFQKPLCPEDRP